MTDHPDRQSAIDNIRAAYERYATNGHTRRWSHANLGESMLSGQARSRILDHLASVAGTPESRILDLGCGDGSLLVAARARGIQGQWVGVDVRPEVIALAPTDDQRASFVVASADALDEPDSHFDAVVAAVLFSSLPSNELERAVAREIARVLRPGGSLIWYDMRYPSPRNAAVHAMPRSRVRRLFSGWPARLESLTLLPPLARRLGAATRTLYPRLHRLPLLRSHLAGRLQKPADPAPRLLLVTGLWPTAEMPSAGSFVRDRVTAGGPIRVVGPRRYDTPMVIRYLRLLSDALTARGSFRGVEAHVLFPTGVIGLIAARLRRLPLVVYVHGDEVRNAVYRNGLYTWLGRMVARRAAAVVANSQDTAAYTRRLGRADVDVVPPGIDLSRFRPSPRPAKRRVLYIGGDRHEKGINVARGLADTLAGAYLDEIDPADVPRLLAEHDVLLVPSVQEGFGLAAAEAIASGRWVVANAVGGLLEVITDGVNGTLVRDGDYVRALACVPDYDPVAVAATAERFSIRAHREGLRHVWERVLAH